MKEYVFSPRQFNADQIPEDKLEQIKDVHNRIASKLDNELGRTATFQDFVNDKIEKTSYENADKMFEAYKFAWSAIGRDTKNSAQVYDNTFNPTTLSKSHKKTNENSNSTRDKSFYTFLYVVFGVAFLIFIYRLGELPFIVIGFFGLFALLYIGDKEGWGK
ncbi:hypothetical protein [Mesonia maritima]|uniref:Uncharacterized protein n=1 Tax=Mesonia maritima TaxID=1793873 RepID=A0ABU1K2S5_9FLAO|nr:hypothetical protein [Mesonia maritima]MDR6299914.1 hypothetical protein [Mesonia maritima]